jgi:hypothetical protein
MKTSYELMNTYGKNPGTTAKVLCNKIAYSLARSVLKPPPDGWLQSRWHWFRSPFSLRRQVLWSKPLHSWFCPENESALECMLHLPSYEPVAWAAPKAGDVFLDIGAYIGWYTIQASVAVGPSGPRHSFRARRYESPPAGKQYFSKWFIKLLYGAQSCLGA